ncbi:MAG: tetratricopeptide repeat protein [Clostridiaceae bacterium]|nr:tetratricopeptide repeat protein [Clostridiaceae bacterium]
MKKNTIVKVIVYAAIPILTLYLLFRLNIFAGILGLLTYILICLYLTRTTIYRLRGQMEYQKGNTENALKWFKKAIQNKNAGIELKVSYGFILLKTGRLAEAEEILLDSLEKSKDPNDKNLTKSNLALVLWKKGELDNAISMLKEVIAEYKTTAVYGSLGYMMIEKGDLDEALEFNLEAAEYNAENTIIMDNLAHLYHLRGEMDKAEEIFNKLIEKSPHFPEAWYDYGKFLEDKGKKDEAAEMYRKALSYTFSFNSTITREQVQKCLDEVSDINSMESIG